jgi:hypothetical protein
MYTPISASSVEPDYHGNDNDNGNDNEIVDIASFK